MDVENASRDSLLRLAEEKKARGNDHYVKKQYAAALECYTAAIDAASSAAAVAAAGTNNASSPTTTTTPTTSSTTPSTPPLSTTPRGALLPAPPAAFYSNRAATYMMLNKWAEALADAREATKLDPGFVKGHAREAKCHLVLGDPKAAVRCYQAALRLEPGNEAAAAESRAAQAVIVHEANADADYARGEFRRVVYSMDRALEQSVKCARYKLTKAEALAMLGRFQEAQELANEVLQADNMNCDALFVRGLCLYYADNLEKAYQHFQQVGVGGCVRLCVCVCVFGGGRGGR